MNGNILFSAYYAYFVHFNLQHICSQINILRSKAARQTPCMLALECIPGEFSTASGARIDRSTERERVVYAHEALTLMLRGDIVHCVPCWALLQRIRFSWQSRSPKKDGGLYCCYMIQVPDSRLFAFLECHRDLQVVDDVLAVLLTCCVGFCCRIDTRFAWMLHFRFPYPDFHLHCLN